MFTVTIMPEAQDFINNSDSKTTRNIYRHIEQLRQNPARRNKHVKGERKCRWQIEIGKVRLWYKKYNAPKIITILEIAARKSAWRRGRQSN